MWAVAGSGNDPNSPRSPPLQNDGPLPDRRTAVMRVVDGGQRQRLGQPVAQARR